ncbi:MAG: hypothetical protein M3R70_12450 [Actinomycetota bacterium]|nr:hypothetical protein [Actinomycetota bacterium]
MSEPYSAAHLKELGVDSGGPSRWVPIRSHFGIASFGINAFTAAETGAALVTEHDEAGPSAGRHEELYFVSAGHATFTVNGEEVDAPAGTFVFVRDPAAKRAAVAKAPATTVVAMGGKPGEAFTTSVWERSAPALAYWNQDWDRAVELLLKAHDEHPDDPALLYNLGCAEAQRGNRDSALGYLRRSLEIDREYRKQAREDPDFAPISGDPEFQEATA